MADKKVSDLPALATADATDVIPLVDISAGVTKKVTVAGLIAALLGVVPNNALTAPMLATNAITLGLAKITSNFTSSSNTPVQITGLAAAVTVPAGGRNVRITVFVPHFDAGSVTSPILSIWDGTVGSGTQIGSGSNTIGSAGFRTFISASTVVTPAAGAKTYSVGLQNSASVAVTAQCSATSPAYILVEAI